MVGAQLGQVVLMLAQHTGLKFSLLVLGRPYSTLALLGT